MVLIIYRDHRWELASLSISVSNFFLASTIKREQPAQHAH